MDTIKFTDLARQFVDCDLDVDRGKGCLAMILSIYEGMGVIFPEEYKGFTRRNFIERWKAGEGIKELEEFISSLGRGVELNFARPGDIVYGGAGKHFIFGVYLGCDSLLVMIKEGGRVVLFSAWKKFLKGARRLIESSKQ